MLPLFETHPRLAARLPWIQLGDWPTPIVRAERFGSSAGLSSFFVKREDLSQPTFGGNKVRGLEFLLADARRRGARTIVTVGAAGSHHIARTAWHAAQLGLRTAAVIIRQPMAEYVRRNLLVSAGSGARIVPANRVTIVPLLAWQLLRPRNWAAGRPAYFIMPGGTTPLACIGHVNAAFELRGQIERGNLPEPDCLFVPLGSLGTAAGLLIGCRLAGLRTRVVGVVTSYRWYATAKRVSRLARRTMALMQRIDPDLPDITIAPSDLDVVESALGRAYADFTDDSARLARSFSEAEGIAFDGTYTAKTLTGAMQYITKRQLVRGVHLFWHTYCRAGAAAGDATALAWPGWLSRYLREPNQPLDALLESAPADGAPRRGSPSPNAEKA